MHAGGRSNHTHSPRRLARALGIAQRKKHVNLGAMARSFLLLWLSLGSAIRPYVPPSLGPEPLVAAADVKVVEVLPANGAWDANVLARPTYTAPLVGNVARGARLTVRGIVTPSERGYCPGEMYYALEPQGYLCASDASPTEEPASTESVLQLAGETPVPYRYVQVGVPEGTTLPMWDSLDSLRNYTSPERELSRGDSVAIDGEGEHFDGESYHVSLDGKLLPTTGTSVMKKFSAWQGVSIANASELPFGWVTANTLPVYDAPEGKKIGELVRRQRVSILPEQVGDNTRFLRIGEGQYVKADQVNEVRTLARPEGTGTHAQWIDIDLGEQVLVAYQAGQPVFATLISSGREPNHTPRGNYPIWGKAAAVTMKSQDYDDSPYYVDRVPWVMFFQAHNALHAAYWHDRFGNLKSHGCANLAPRDAKHLFDWLEPVLPAGWTAVRYWDLTQAPVVHVRNSKRAKPFFQERSVGPPDKEEETERLEKALLRREAKAREEAAAAAAGYSGAAPRWTPATPLAPLAPLGPPTQLAPLAP